MDGAERPIYDEPLSVNVSNAAAATLRQLVDELWHAGKKSAGKGAILDKLIKEARLEDLLPHFEERRKRRSGESR